MTSKLPTLCRSCSRIAYGVFLLLFVLTAGAVVKFGNLPSLGLSLLVCAVGVAAGVAVLHPAGKLAERLGRGKTRLILLAVCLLVKLAWVLAVTIPPAGDYETFYLTAKNLLEQPVLLYPRYVSLFPHILGYSRFLSMAMALFGTDYLVAPVLNAVLSTLSAGLIFYLGDRLSGLPLATAATLLWIICPSQTIYNMFILSEPLYTTIILLFLCLLVGFHTRERQLRWHSCAIAGAAGGVLLAAVNATRPVAVILVIGLFLWLALLQTDGWRQKNFRVKWIPFAAALLVFFLAAGSLWNGYAASRLGEEPASTPGFNVLVGLNPDSGGAWNAEDSQLLDRYNTPDATPQEIQAQLLDDALDRAASGAVNFPRLFLQKLHIFLGSDSSAAQYAADVLPYAHLFGYLSSGFYYGAAALSLVTAVILLRRGDRSLLFMPMVYVIGLTMAHMLVEVAGRYHYSIIPTLCLLGGWGALWLAGRLRQLPERGLAT